MAVLPRKIITTKITDLLFLRALLSFPNFVQSVVCNPEVTDSPSVISVFIQ